MKSNQLLVESASSVGPSQRRRLAVLGGLLILAFAGLAYRLVDLQGVCHEDLLETARRMRQHTLVRAPLRGKILDCKGTVLAAGALVKTIAADPTLIGTNRVLLARALAPRLGLSEQKLVELLQPRVRTNNLGRSFPVRYVVLKRKVAPEDWAAIHAALERLPLGEDDKTVPRAERRRRAELKRRLIASIRADPVDDQVRFYPCGTLAAHVIGHTGVNDGATNSLGPGDIVGKDGIELTMNAVLSGVRGWREMEWDRWGRELVLQRGEDIAPHPGLNVVLTLDATLQQIVETELQAACDKHNPNSISCLVVRPRTGEILALANLPTFDPNRPGDPATPAAARRNRAIADIAEPGSTFKVLVIAGALEAGAVDLTDEFDCEQGRFSFRGQSLGDVHRYGVLSVQNIVAKSSNIGAAKVGIRMGERLIYNAIRRFGIGEFTGIPLPGEIRGIVHPTNRWSKISVAWIPMGHEVAATPLQMTMAVSTVANGGRLMRPLLVKRIVDDQGLAVANFPPVFVRQVIREETARKMVEALKTAVQSGTGVKAQLECYPVAGKTGTAQKVVNGAYVHDKHFSSFIGFFPADDPELCISVVLDEPKNGRYGAETAAPVFRAIAQQAASYLGIPPVVPPEAQPGRRETLVDQHSSPTAPAESAGSRL